ncbi:MAG: hypothetical protein H0U59_05655 [Gemmatimonadaceae bacterium]|nr:hypothetical protein [Gemmatimonadaceae bacterium]MDQ3242446.1 4-vinyl reductase [Gemmatimonadota bacterium]
MTETASSRLIGIALPTLRKLRVSVMACNGGSEAVRTLREAGYAGGSTVHAAFEHWLEESAPGESSEPSTADPGDLSLTDFGERASHFFRDAGWGDVTFSSDDSDGTAMLDVVNCWETANDSAGDVPGCHITTGMLAAFFGKIAGYPVAVLEAECAGSGSERCRFLLGNADLINYKWDSMSGTTGSS